MISIDSIIGIVLVGVTVGFLISAVMKKHKIKINLTPTTNYRTEETFEYE